jgi:ABC-type multidrug transport system fused ATPase/permease subunit
MVIVMDKGQCAEYGTPRELLATPTSHFKSLVDALGEKEAATLAEQVK